MSSPRLIPLGIISAAHGIRGEVKIRTYTQDPDNLTAYGPLRDSAGKIYNVTVLSHTKDALIARIEGIQSRNDAEQLRNTELCVPREALPAPSKNQYYHEDLVGLKLTTKDGAPYGSILAVHNFGAGDLVTVRTLTGSEEMVPFTRATFPTIDIASGVAVIDTPDILD